MVKGITALRKIIDLVYSKIRRISRPIMAWPWNCQSFKCYRFLFMWIWDVLKMQIGIDLTTLHFISLFSFFSRKEETNPTPNHHPLPCDDPPWKHSPRARPNIVPEAFNQVPLRWNPGAFPLVPPRLQHGYKAGEDNASSQDTKTPAKLFMSRAPSFLLCVHWGVQVTLPILGPPLVLQNVHVTILLKLQILGVKHTIMCYCRPG